MRLKSAFLFCVLAGLALTVAGFAQEGHPLTGTWYGDWGPPNATDRNHLTIEMQWNGKEVTGTVNPGPNSYPLKATLDSSKWTVHIEADAKDDKGAVSHVVADGKLDNIGSYNRTITGTWNYGSQKGTFKLRRD